MDVEDIIEHYNKNAATYAASRAGTEDKDGLVQLAELVKPPAKILDVGCAAGRDTRIMKNMGYDAVGVDLAGKLLDIARRANPDITFVLGDMKNLPFGSDVFDVVWASAVLHHAPKQRMKDVLTEFKRVLIPGGILYVRTKAGRGTLTTRESSVGHEERQFALLSSPELAELLAETGFAKISLEERASKSRPGLRWLRAFYKKPAVTGTRS